MKTSVLTTALSATLLFFISCSEKEAIIHQADPVDATQKKEVFITASLDEGTDSGTRTSLVTDENDKPAAIYWTPGDKIKVFSDGQAAEFTSVNEEPTHVARFRGTVSFITGADDGVEPSYVWGLYPYREDAVYDEPTPGVSRTATITTTLPAIQTGKAGTFDDSYAITVGRSESLSIAFKSVYTMMRFSVTRDDIKAVSFKGNNNEAIAGRFTVGIDETAYPPLSYSQEY